MFLVSFYGCESRLLTLDQTCSSFLYRAGNFGTMWSERGNMEFNMQNEE